MPGERNYSLRIKICGLPETPNQTRHWAHRMRHNMKWQRDIHKSIGRNKPPKPLTKAMVKYIRASAYEPDFDNMVASFKPVQDALVSSGVLADDNPAVIRVEYEWRHAPPKGGYIEVAVSEDIVDKTTGVPNQNTLSQGPAGK